MNIQGILENIGMSEKEAQVYLALLELGEALPSTLARRANVKRPTVYAVLEQLSQRGLVSSCKKAGNTYFQGISPHFLLEQQYQKTQTLEHALPELLALKSKFAVQPQVVFFEGQKGLIQIMEDTLTSSTELLCWADAELITSSLAEYYPTYIRKKVERKLWVRAIVCDDPTAVVFQQKGKKELREIYRIPKDEFPFQNEINIYDDKVAIISHADQVGVIIQNKNIADTQRSIFQFAFKYAKLVGK